MKNILKIIMLLPFMVIFFGCSGNIFKDNSDLNVFTFSLFGYDDYKFCNNINSSFIDKYPSGKNPSRICIRYQYYICHINYYCPNFKTESERKKCEHDAAQYWNPVWQGTEDNLTKRVQYTKEKCEIEAKKNS